jgi:hypothetical protein
MSTDNIKNASEPVADFRLIKVAIPGFANQKVEVIPPGFFRGTHLMVNGQPAPKGSRRGEYLLTDDKGQPVTVRFRNQAFGLDYPQLELGKQTIHIVAPLKWYVWAWAILPFLLVTFGGALGGLIGLIAGWSNIRLMRQPWHWLARLGITLGVSLLALFTWFLLYLILYRP